MAFIYPFFQKNRLLIPLLVLALSFEACSPTAKLKDLPSVKFFEQEITKFDSLTAR